MNIIALIPARSGSKRIPDKNIRELNGKPLIYWTIRSAQQSGVFSDIIVSTDSQKYADIVLRYGVSVPRIRPKKFANDYSPDFDWVHDFLRNFPYYDCFSILRPTNPFRTANTIRRAWDQFQRSECDSLRAVEKCSQHPCKMWRVKDGFMTPIVRYHGMKQPWHSSPYQTLPEVYVQNASLEMAHTDVVFKQHSISGKKIVPFYTNRYEGFDINTEDDWMIAEHIINEFI